MITVDLNSLSLPGHSRILDIGCGSGRHTAAAYGLDHALVVGIDLKMADLHQARSRLDLHEQIGARGRDSCCCLAAADIRHLPFDDHGFDLVICSEVLEHLHDHRQAIGEIVRALKPGGHLVVSVPRQWPETLCWLLSRAYRKSPGGHVRIVNATSLAATIERHGLRHRRTHWAHSLHAPYWWLKCLVGLERDTCPPVRLYHRLLTWDIMTHPRVTRCIDRWLNPLMGKSVVLYFDKPWHREFAPFNRLGAAIPPASWSWDVQ